MLPQLARQRAQGAEVAPLATEVPLLEQMVTAQPTQQHRAGALETNGCCHGVSCGLHLALCEFSAPSLGLLILLVQLVFLLGALLDLSLMVPLDLTLIVPLDL